MSALPPIANVRRRTQSQHLAVGLSVHALARKMRNDLVRSFRERDA